MAARVFPGKTGFQGKGGDMDRKVIAMAAGDAVERGWARPWAWAALAVCMACASVAAADCVQMKNGDTLSGKITSVNDQTIVVVTPYMGAVSINRADVATFSLEEVPATPPAAAPAPAPAAPVATVTPAAPEAATGGHRGG